MTALGLDVGGTRIKAGLVDPSGAIVAQKTAATPDGLERFRAVLAGMLTELAAGVSPIAGVGIGCKGSIDSHTTRVEALPGTLNYLEGFRLSQFVPLELPVRADNDARVAMTGEMVWGAARGRDNAVMLTLGTGVGGAVVAGGTLLRGARGVAGHLGHMTIDPDGPVCICGNRGCLETFFSARAIEAEAFRAIHAGCDSSLTRRFRSHPETLTCQAVFEAAAEGDEIARQIRDRAVHCLAAAIAGLLHIFDPEIVILGGQIAEAGPALLDPLRSEIAWRTRYMLRREVPLVPAEVLDRSGILGAAALVFSARP